MQRFAFGGEIWQAQRSGVIPPDRWLPSHPCGKVPFPTNVARPAQPRSFPCGQENAAGFPTAAILPARRAAREIVNRGPHRGHRNIVGMECFSQCHLLITASRFIAVLETSIQAASSGAGMLGLLCSLRHSAAAPHRRILTVGRAEFVSAVSRIAFSFGFQGRASRSLPRNSIAHRLRGVMNQALRQLAGGFEPQRFVHLGKRLKRSVGPLAAGAG